MSQVATETAGTSSLIPQGVHSLDATGLRDADSSLQFKTLGLPTRQATPTATVPHEQKQTRDGVRRSRRLVEKSTRLKKSSSSHSSTQRRSSKHKQHHSGQSGRSSHAGNPPSSSHSSAVSTSTVNSTSSMEDAPQSSRLTRNSNSNGDSSVNASGERFDIRAQTTSPVQLEHSYALTFSSTAEEISYNTNPPAAFHEAPPTTTPLSSSQTTSSIPVSVIQSSSSHVHSSPSRGQVNRRHRRRHNISGPEARTSTLDSALSGRASLPPYMLSSTQPIAMLSRPSLSLTEHAQNNGHILSRTEHAQNSGHAFSLTEHALNNGHEHALDVRTTIVNEEAVVLNDSSVQGLPHGHVAIQVPLAMPFSRYTSGRPGLHTELVSSRNEDAQRERERLEHSTSFIAARSRDRPTTTRRRGRRRNRNVDQMEEQVEEASSSSNQHHTRDRSPHGVPLPFSLAGRPSRQRRAGPSSHSTSSVPLSSVSLPSVRSVSHLPPPHALGFQIVPQLPVGVASDSDGGMAYDHSAWRPLHRQGGMSINLSSPLSQSRLEHGLTRNSSQPIFHDVIPSYVNIPASHSSSSFHRPSSIRGTTSAGIESGSHSSGLPGSMPPLIHVYEGGSTSGEESAVERGIHTVSHDHNDVIIVDSSDSEDDDVIVSHVTRPSPRRQQITTDEEFARRLQDQFDREVDDHMTIIHTSPGPSVPSGLRPPLTRPPIDHNSGSLIRDNYEALLSHIHRLSVPDMTRLLEITRTHARRRTGRNPRSQAEFARAMENMGEILLVNALFRAPVVSGTSYEDLLELAETLGPARPQGLPQQVIDNLPLREFSSSMDTTTPGEQPKCVVCMCDFEERDNLRTLPCVHEFHQQCIDQWLKDHRTCPICRVELNVPS